jgi:hypothetical protein
VIKGDIQIQGTWNTDNNTEHENEEESNLNV